MEKPELLTRPSVPSMDAMLGMPYPVLDHGFIRLIDYMGDEAAILQAARVSYGTGTKQALEDVGLLRYLMRHRHTTPFEMCEIKLHVKLPIFVARQWIRHRTANVNEYSARYSILEREFYVPKTDDILQQSTTNKQGRGEALTEDDRVNLQHEMKKSGNRAFDLYDLLTNEEEDGFNVARELARVVTPVSAYTQWYWKVDAHNLLHFLSLRADPHAQMEIRVYAEEMLRIVRAWLPNVYQAFVDYHMESVTFSGPEMEFLRAVIRQSYMGHATQDEIVGASKREVADFNKKLGLT